MANKTKQAERDRRAKIEAMRKAEQAKERRKSMLFIIVAAVVGLGLVAAAAVPAYLDSKNDPANKDLASFGVARAAADCGAVSNDPVTGNPEHYYEVTFPGASPAQDPIRLRNKTLIDIQSPATDTAEDVTPSTKVSSRVPRNFTAAETICFRVKP